MYNDFSAPVDALLLPNGDLVVAEGRGQVVRVPASRPDSREVMTNLEQPAGLLWADGSLYVSDHVAGKVYQLVADGQTLQEPHLVVEALGPEGLAMDEAGRLLVVERGRVTVVDLKTGGRQHHMTLSRTDAPPLAVFPASQLFNGIAAGAGGTYVADTLINRVLHRGTRGDCASRPQKP